MKNGATLVVDNFAKFTRGVEIMVNTQVMVGVPATEALRKPEPGEDKQPPNNALLAYVHENGDAAGRIPPRPFLKPGVDRAKDVIVSGLEKAGNAALDGKVDAVLRHLHGVGLRAQAAVRRAITVGPHKPLAPATIARRRARGRKGTKPLIDTAQLRNAINYVLRKLTGGARK